MNKIPLLAGDSFVVLNKSVLHNSDRNILIMLYQPIIGSSAISLYFTLWSYLDKLEIMSVEWTHHHLMSSLKFRLEEIMDALEMLEGIGLIKTYLKESESINSYVYELYSPMSAYEFLTNPILATALYNNVGASEYDSIIKFYKTSKVDLSKYKDITSSFCEVFKTDAKTQYDIICDDIRRSNKRKMSVVTDVDINELLSRFNSDLLDVKKVNKDVKEYIYKLSFIYNLNNDDLEKLILDSINGRVIDLNLLRESSKKYYKFEHSGKLPSIVHKNQPEYLRKEVSDTSNKAKVIHQFETTTPYQFLLSKQKGGKPSKYDLSILEYLLLDLGLEPGVVNVLIDYVLRVNNNKLTKAYVEAIAGQWKRSNISTVEEAMQFALSQKNKGTRSKKESKPVWFDQKIDENPLSVDEIKEMENLLKEFKE
ncbi:MAG: DnaD domain protein [Bacilli bacterium]|nr:DnaD domain protein [Bacilli bacterium]